MKQKVRYYVDELNDDFSKARRKTLYIGGDYNYVKKGFLNNLAAFFVYRIVMVPVAFLYVKIILRQKTVGRKNLKKVKKGGYFTYSNHALTIGDAFIPNIINLPKRTYTVVHPDNISVKGLQRFLEYNGAMPLPASFSATKNFVEAIKLRINSGCAVEIYPEAHLWPYYTGIRPFTAKSLYYPVNLNVPIFAVTNTFKRSRFFKKPKVITYVDGLFYPNENLSVKERERDLRNKIYDAMQSRAKENDYEYIKYVKKEKNDD